MTPKRVLITGGAGFVGSHTADALLEAGHSVRIFDSLDSQVHSAGIYSYLPNGAEFVLGDVRNRTQLSKAVRGMEVIFHLAAAVGVGQSMYKISDYMAVNSLGTANLLQAILALCEAGCPVSHRSRHSAPGWKFPWFFWGAV